MVERGVPERALAPIEPDKIGTDFKSYLNDLFANTLTDEQQCLNQGWRTLLLYQAHLISRIYHASNNAQVLEKIAPHDFSNLTSYGSIAINKIICRNWRSFSLAKTSSYYFSDPKLSSLVDEYVERNKRLFDSFDLPGDAETEAANA